MVGRALKHWVSRMLARFLSNTRGGVAPLMAVVAVPVLAVVGMAVDYTRANPARTAFQVSLDLYTIQVNTGGDPTSTLLQNCASDPAKFYLLTSADQITATFQTIGTNLTKLRVAQ